MLQVETARRTLDPLGSAWIGLHLQWLNSTRFTVKARRRAWYDKVKDQIVAKQK
jgi:hypothetical protein